MTTRGLERVCAGEIAALADVEQVAWRRVVFSTHACTALLGLRTVDDCFIEVAATDGIGRQRTALAALTTLAAGIDLRPALTACATVRAIPSRPAFAVTASFVGRRNYSSDEIKAAVAPAVARRHGWRAVVRDDDADLNLRLFIEHERALLGVRLARRPLQERAWKSEDRAGSLKPPVAAAMARIAGDVGTLVDPCCGVGTIALEAAALGHAVLAGDVDGAAVAATRRHTRAARAGVAVARWDATRLPLPSEAVGALACNPPWDRQVAVDGRLEDLWRGVIDEARRVVARGGKLVLLVPGADPLSDLGGERIAIGLAGQEATIVVLAR